MKRKEREARLRELEEQLLELEEEYQEERGVYLDLRRIAGMEDAMDRAQDTARDLEIKIRKLKDEIVKLKE